MTPAEFAAYCQRLGLSQPPPASPEGVAQVLAAHRQAIPFENLAIPLGEGVRIDSASVHAKLVSARRGGYCFEQNRLFADGLAALGLPSRPLLARVRLGLAEGQTPPRTHVLLLVDCGGEPLIADAGFGGAFVPPLPLRHGAGAQTPDGAAHRLTRREGGDPLGGEWLLERAGPSAATDGRAIAGSGWQPQYSFDLAPIAPEDLEQANHWTATRPGTRFTTLRVVSRVLPTGFAALTDRSLTLYESGAAATREIADLADYAATLREVFALELAEAELARLGLF
jgi:N-hydroxyarylamine O-acetyltransferase